MAHKPNFTQGWYEIPEINILKSSNRTATYSKSNQDSHV